MLNLQHIPLAKLVPSAANVRKTGRQDGVRELAASIKAHGLLQNLTVRSGKGDTKGNFEVIAGGRRLAALRILEKQKHLKPTAKIPCHVDESDSAEEISLAENQFQCPMHPADQYEAFAKLHREQEMPVEDIAARFGVTPAVVTQRLKLGSVSPKLIKRYRAGELSLDLLSAFTITDDHKAQERVWKELPSYHRSRHAILEALTEAKVPADDRRARFIGAGVYQEAGGTITRDLFDPEDGGFFDNPALLNTLVRDKLQRKAAKIMAEGWKWVSVEPEFDHGAAADMRRLHPALNKEDQATLDALEKKRDDLWESEEGPDSPEEFETLEADIDALKERECFAPEDIARCGAFVCLDSEGGMLIERGYLRKEDAAPAPKDDGAVLDTDAGESSSPKGLSEKLIAEVTAARTQALRCELSQQPDLALTAVVHSLAARLLYDNRVSSCLDLIGRYDSLAAHAPLEAESLAGHALATHREEWQKRLPREVEDLWQALADMSGKERMALLAFCAALTVNAVRDGRHSASELAHADLLHKALPLDMTRYWKPTVANYLGRVSKAKALEAVGEGVTPEAADNLASLKKQAMAEAAQQRLEGKGWLPDLLRTP